MATGMRIVNKVKARNVRQATFTKAPSEPTKKKAMAKKNDEDVESILLDDTDTP